MPRQDEDNIQINSRVTAVCLNAIEKVFSETDGKDDMEAAFELLDSTEKRAFLGRHGKEIIDICIRDRTVGQAFNNKVVLWVENEEQRTAGLVLTKRKPIHG